MIPFPLALKTITGFFGSIPRWLWIAIGVPLAVVALVWWHNDKVSDARKEGYAAGVKYEGERIAKKADAIKAKANALTSKISQVLKDNNDAENRAIIRTANDYRLSGPGKATCSSHTGIPAGPGGSVAPSGRSDASRPEMPANDLAAVPWGWLVGEAEKCDLNRAEVLTWREWYAQQSAAWAKLSGN